MDDEILTGVWQLDPDTRLKLRLGTVREAVRAKDWPRVVLEAEELLDDVPRHGETLGLLANALLELGDCANAVDAFEDHLALHEPTAPVLSGLAIARFETCDLVGAIEAAREAIRLDPSFAEAHYSLGLALERSGQGLQSAQSFQAANALDPTDYPLPMALTDEVLTEALRRALPALPPALIEFWKEVPIQIEDQPSLTELTASTSPVPPTVAGLYKGVPPEGEAVLTARPEALRLFRRNLARAGSLEEVSRQLALVLEQEALDWLGVPLEELER